MAPKPQVGRAVPVQQFQSPGAGYAISAWPQAVERKWGCVCGKLLRRERLVTQTAPVKGTKARVAKAERWALLCEDCGVIAWETP